MCREEGPYTHSHLLAPPSHSYFTNSHTHSPTVYIVQYKNDAHQMLQPINNKHQRHKRKKNQNQKSIALEVHFLCRFCLLGGMLISYFPCLDYFISFEGQINRGLICVWISIAFFIFERSSQASIRSIRSPLLPFSKPVERTRRSVNLCVAVLRLRPLISANLTQQRPWRFKLKISAARWR